MSALPDNWRKVRLRDVAVVRYGKALNTDDRDTNGNVPVMGSSAKTGFHSRAYHEKPSIVIGRKGSVGSVAVVREPFWPIDTVFFLDEISPLVEIEFLGLCLLHLDLDRYKILVGVPGIGRTDLEAFKFPLPPLSEQQRIVEIWQAAGELDAKPLEYEQNALRKKYRDQIDHKKEGEEARRFLNELDWLWPTHASFHFHSHAQNAINPDAARCFWLLALASAVIRHPLGEARAVVNLGTCSHVTPGELAGNRELTDALKLLAQPMTGARCGADALRTLFGGERDPHETLWDIFETLREWRAHGILKEVDLTVKRVHRLGEGERDPDDVAEDDSDADPEADDVILTYSSFSDGERMLLSRMAFLLLLKGQENSLLLLDEPETHFNDSWKRQIIDLIDDNLLRDTSAHVLVSTHTSLALTDVFDSEITRLWKEGGITSINPLSQPTFGADPGRILLNVFNAPDVIGKRAAEFLRDQLDPAKWPPERKEELEMLIDEVGSGWPRAKLMDILDQIEANE